MPHKKRVKKLQKARRAARRERLEALRVAKLRPRVPMGPVVKLHPPPGVNPTDPAASSPMFAVVTIQARQHKVVPNDLVMVNKYPAAVSESLTFDQVLLVGTPGYTVVGRPLIPKASVTATVEEHTQLAKILTFKMRRRKGSSARLKGARPPVTLLRINSIDYDLPVAKDIVKDVLSGSDTSAATTDSKTDTNAATTAAQ